MLQIFEVFNFADMNENDLTKDFAPVSAQQWKDALEQSLKGKTSFERLHWQSPEGLEIAPFYNEETTGGEKLGAANNKKIAAIVPPAKEL